VKDPDFYAIVLLACGTMRSCRWCYRMEI